MKKLDALTDTEIKYLKSERARLAEKALNAKHPADCERTDKALEAFDSRHPQIRNMR